MKAPTHDMNPAKKLLNGKVPTSKQYRNCNAPTQNDLWACFVSLPNQDLIWTLNVTNRNQLNALKPGTVSPLLYSVFVSQYQKLTIPVEWTYFLWTSFLYYIDCTDTSCRRCMTPSVALNHSLCLTCWVSDGAPDPKFPMDSAMAEEQSVSTEGMILLGHISHLILVDPWGFQPMPVDATSGSTRPGCPCWVEALIAFSTLFNPLALIRAAGPW
ncbi:unnamed protein product, partial [Coregonus sp. 'balchen']